MSERQATAAERRLVELCELITPGPWPASLRISGGGWHSAFTLEAGETYAHEVRVGDRDLTLGFSKVTTSDGRVVQESRDGVRTLQWTKREHIEKPTLSFDAEFISLARDVTPSLLTEIARLRADHDRRVAELLEANGREVERRRRVEAELVRLRAVLRPLAELARTRTVAHAYQQGILLSLSNGERMCGVDPKALLEASMALEETGQSQP